MQYQTVLPVASVGQRTAPIRTQAPPAATRAVPAVRRLRPVSAGWIRAKRCIDVSVALAGLTLSAPLLAVAAVSICVASPGRPLFVQTRVGQFGRRFRMFKLRTMVVDAEARKEELRLLNEAKGPVFKMKTDPRVFPLGRWLRKTSLDEIPNLFNVLTGTMSIVGPRPPLPSEVEHYDDFAQGRLRVKPGITGLWQISGRSDVDFDRWMELDNRYVETWTPLGDILIILKTLPAVLFSRGAY